MIELNIEKLAFGGRGIGYDNGKAVFVPYTMPGDRVACKVVREKKRYCEAEPVELLQPAPQRQQPRCPVFADCGGCQWQHLPYPLQLEWKEQLFRDALVRQHDLDEGLFDPIVSSPNEWHYRCRAQIKCRKVGDRFVAGFYRAGSHYVVDIDHCPLLALEINSVFTRIKSHLANFDRVERISQIDLSVDDSGQVCAIIHYLETPLEPLWKWMQPLVEELNLALFVQQGSKQSLTALTSGPEPFIRPLRGDDMRLHYPPGGFVQVNLEQNRNLVDDVCREVSPDSRILDLFCGIGNFSLPLARTARRVVGIEDYALAIDAAIENGQRNGLDNSSFVATAAERGLQEQWQNEDFEVVLLDPPRTGACEVARQLVDLRPARIIYISCDPMTLARDLKPLLNGGYRPLKFRAYDMFPQTGHIESLTLLERIY